MIPILLCKVYLLPLSSHIRIKEEERAEWEEVWAPSSAGRWQVSIL